MTVGATVCRGRQCVVVPVRRIPVFTVRLSHEHRHTGWSKNHGQCSQSGRLKNALHFSLRVRFHA